MDSLSIEAVDNCWRRLLYPAIGGERVQQGRDHHKGFKNVDLTIIISELDSPSLSLAELTVNCSQFP